MCLFIHSVKRWKINFISLYPKYAVKKYSIYLFSLFILLINILFIVKFPHANAESLRNISYKPMKRSEKECLLLCQCLIGIMILKYLMRCNVFVFLKKRGYDNLILLHFWHASMKLNVFYLLDCQFLIWIDSLEFDFSGSCQSFNSL